MSDILAWGGVLSRLRARYVHDVDVTRKLDEAQRRLDCLQAELATPSMFNAAIRDFNDTKQRLNSVIDLCRDLQKQYE